MKLGALSVLLSLVAWMASAYEVRLPTAPQPWEKTAAEELKGYLGKFAAGNSVKVAGEEAVFHVGDTDFARARKLGAADLEDERWVVRSFGRDVVLAGGGSRGTLYALFHFLEDSCGVRWWSDHEESVPAPAAVSFAKLDATGKPAFSHRDFALSHRDGTRTPRNAIRFRLNHIHGLQIPLAWGGAVGFGAPSFVHTFNHYIPAEKHFKDHPEYFSQIGEKRVGGTSVGQLCLSNPEVKRIITERLFEFIAASEADARKGGWAAPKIYDISENDNGNFCQCAKCREEQARYGLSGQYVRFLNDIAAVLKARRPDLMLETLAYLMAMEPPPKDPNVIAADNLIIRLCDTRGNQASSILEDDNAGHRAAIDGWRRHAKNIFIWDYAITYGADSDGFPFPSEFTYGDLYRFYRDHGVTGVFWEHEQYDEADMFELKFYLERRLMEDPDQDCNALIERFMREYYGAAGAEILGVRRDLDKIRRARKAYVSWFPPVGAFSYIRDEDVVRYEQAFDRAEQAVAGDATLLKRVRRARLGTDRLALSRGPDDTLVRHNIARPEPSAELAAVIAAARVRLGVKAPAAGPKKVAPPPQFADRRYYDFYPDMFKPVYDGNPKLVDDPTSPVGRASRLDTDRSTGSRPPLRLAYWNQTDRKETRRTDISAIDPAPGYHWYHMGLVTVAPDGYIYLARGWLPQLVVSHSELVGRTFDVWVSIRVEGPAYRAGDTAPNAQYIDRVILCFTEPASDGNSVRVRDDGTLRDRSWMWGHQSWQVDGKHAKLYGLDVAKIDYPMIDGARSFGLENLNVIRWDKPDKTFRDSLKGMKRLTWPMSGHRVEVNSTYDQLGDWNFAVAEEMENVTGFELDDFFHPEDMTPTVAQTPEGPKPVCPTAFSYAQLCELRRRMRAFRRPLELRLVVYDDLFRRRTDPSDLKPAIDVADAVTFWIWKAANMDALATSFRRYRAIAPDKPTYLGVYLWDFGGARPMPVETVGKELVQGLDWFKRGEIVGFVFLCSSICNRDDPAVNYCRNWLRENGDVRAPKSDRILACRRECRQ